MFFFFSSRRRHTRLQGDWSSDVCSSDLNGPQSCGPFSFHDLTKEGPLWLPLSALNRPRFLVRPNLPRRRDSSTPRFARSLNRSEERRVGEECRSRWSPYY